MMNIEDPFVHLILPINNECDLFIGFIYQISFIDNEPEFDFTYMFCKNELSIDDIPYINMNISSIGNNIICKQNHFIFIK